MGHFLLERKILFVYLSYPSSDFFLKNTTNIKRTIVIYSKITKQKKTHREMSFILELRLRFIFLNYFGCLLHLFLFITLIVFLKQILRVLLRVVCCLKIL